MSRDDPELKHRNQAIMSQNVNSLQSEERYPSTDSSSDDFDSEDVPMIEKSSTDIISSTKRHNSRTTVVILSALLLASLIGNVLLLFLPKDLDIISVKHTSEYWSPIMEGIKVRYESVRFDGSFMNKSIYQQSAGPEVDEAWSGLGIDFRTTVVPEDRGLEAGIHPSAVKVQKSQGGGYLTNVEVLHHLHCLNMIRQTLPWNVDYYRNRSAGVYENSEPIVQLHVDHCLDIIRQQLQCSSDLSMFGQRWIQRKGKDLNVFPIFDTVHKCRNFDDVLTWVKNNQARDGLVAEVRDDDIILEAYP